MTLPTLHPNQASFKLQIWISMVGTCQINSESQSLSKHTARRHDNSSIKTKVVKYWQKHATCIPNDNISKKQYCCTGYRLGQCRAHLRWLPRTWHQSGFRTGLASERHVYASAYHNMSASGLRILEVCQRKAHECITLHQEERQSVYLTEHITRYLTSGLPGRAQAHAWLRGKLKAKGKDFEDAWGLPEDDNFRATSTWLR